MQATTTIGLDIAKSVFQVHGIDAEGNVTLRRRVKRRYVLAFFQKLPPCLVGIEACASSHHWSRELQALGHTVRLMPPAYVKPYVKRHKNDAVDAEAICEAVTRANMRFVATKTPEQQSCLTLHRTRHLFIRQQKTLASRAHDRIACGVLYRREDIPLLGAADLAADLGADAAWEPLAFARSRLVAASALHAVMPIDSPFFDIHDERGLREETGRAVALGFEAKAAIHPNQIAIKPQQGRYRS